jgi:hypothetical protein
VLVRDDDGNLVPRLPEAGEGALSKASAPEGTQPELTQGEAGASSPRLDELRRRRYAEELPALDFSDVMHGRDRFRVLPVAVGFCASVVAGVLANADVISPVVGAMIAIVAGLAWGLVDWRLRRDARRRQARPSDHDSGA